MIINGIDFDLELEIARADLHQKIDNYFPLSEWRYDVNMPYQLRVVRLRNMFLLNTQLRFTDKQQVIPNPAIA